MSLTSKFAFAFSFFLILQKNNGMQSSWVMIMSEILIWSNLEHYVRH